MKEVHRKMWAGAEARARAELDEVKRQIEATKYGTPSDRSRNKMTKRKRHPNRMR